MLIPPKSNQDSGDLEESKQHSKRSELYLASGTMEESKQHSKRSGFYIASGTTQKPKLLDQEFSQRREDGQKKQVGESRVAIDRQKDEKDSEPTQKGTVQIDEREKRWKRQEHITPYRPSGKWSLFWWRVGKVKNWLGEKTGFKNKTLWDLLQLGALPLVIGMMTIYFNSAQSSLKTRIEDGKYRQTALDNYITEMTKIIIDRDLPGVGFTSTESLKDQSQASAQNPSNNKEQKETKRKHLINIAKAKTLTTLLLLNLDEEKRNIVLHFLRTENLCCEQNNQSITILEGIRLVKADLKGAELTEFYLKNANLTQAKLQNAMLSAANLQGATLYNAEMQGATLTAANMSPAQAKTNLAKAQAKTNLAKANLQGSFLMGANLKESNLDQANLNKANLSPAPIPEERRNNLTDEQKKNLTEDKKFLRTDLSGASLQKANLQETDLTKAILKDVDLKKANLKGAKLQGADLTKATFDNADLSNANLQNAKGSETSKAKLCNTTMQDGGVKYRDCWFNIFRIKNLIFQIKNLFSKT